MADGTPLDGVKILIADKNPQSGMKLQALLPAAVRCVGVATDYESAFKLVDGHQPLIVLMNMNMTLTMVNNKFSKPFLVIAIADEAKAEFLRLGIEIKARDLLIQPLTGAQVLDSITRTVRAHQREQQLAAAETPALAGIPAAGQTIAVISSKGGLGQSTLVTNLGLGLAQRKHSTIIVDAIAQVGVQALLLDVPALHSLDDLIGRLQSLSLDELQQAVLSHKSGLNLLAAPVNNEEISADEFLLLLEQLRLAYQTVLIDMPRFSGAAARAILPLLQHIILLLSFNIPSIRNAAMALSILAELGVAKDSITVIGTNFQSSSDLTGKDVEQHLKAEIHVQLPQVPEAILTSVNTGEALLLSEPDNPYSQAIGNLLERFAPGRPPALTASLNPPNLQQKLQGKGWF